jgi:2-methylcitrate dehydratase PrpD
VAIPRLVEQYFNVTNDKLAPVMTAGTLLTSYPSVTQGQAAAIAATGIQDDCTPYANLNIQAVVTGTCPATITVIATDQCGRSSQVTYSNICLWGHSDNCHSCFECHCQLRR